jgi:hypothetical protein
MRIATACSECRQAKRRCIQRANCGVCDSCHERRLICVRKLHSGGKDRILLRPRPVLIDVRTAHVCRAPAKQVNYDLDLSHGIVVELVDLYLEKFHGRPHSLFHPTTLRARARDGNIIPVLLYAICAVASRFSGNPDVRCRDVALAAEAKRLLQGSITNACVENIQACLLVAILSLGHGDAASEVIFIRELRIHV